MTGAEIRTWRRQMGYSAERLAERLGVPANTLSRWERGVQPVRHPGMLWWALQGLTLMHERANGALAREGLPPLTGVDTAAARSTLGEPGTTNTRSEQ